MSVHVTPTAMHNEYRVGTPAKSMTATCIARPTHSDAVMLLPSPRAVSSATSRHPVATAGLGTAKTYKSISELSTAFRRRVAISLQVHADRACAGKIDRSQSMSCDCRL